MVHLLARFWREAIWRAWSQAVGAIACLVGASEHQKLHPASSSAFHSVTIDLVLQSVHVLHRSRLPCIPGDAPVMAPVGSLPGCSHRADLLLQVARALSVQALSCCLRRGCMPRWDVAEGLQGVAIHHHQDLGHLQQWTFIRQNRGFT